MPGTSEDLRGLVVAVTGGTRGIGLAIARRFAVAGATVAVCGRREVELPPGLVGGVCDVRDPAQVEAWITGVHALAGRLDVLVNNAGGSPEVAADACSPRLFQAIVDLNLTAPFVVAQRANLRMQAQAQGGVIVNVASVSGARPSPGTAAYGAAKAGLLSLTRTLAVEWAPKVRVVAITVGLVHAGGADEHYGGADGLDRVRATVPLGRLATPEDVADAALWLASPAAAYVSGAALELHGGGEAPAFLAARRVPGG